MPKSNYGGVAVVGIATVVSLAIAAGIISHDTPEAKAKTAKAIEELNIRNAFKQNVESCLANKGFKDYQLVEPEEQGKKPRFTKSNLYWHNVLRYDLESNTVLLSQENDRFAIIEAIRRASDLPDSSIDKRALKAMHECVAQYTPGG